MFPLAAEGSFLLPGSFTPTILAPNATTSGRRPGSLARVLLDTAAYIADRRNGTFAETTTRTGQIVGVSFWLADPPAVSHLCVHCPGMKVTDFLDEPLVVCSGKDIAVIRVAYSYKARPMESIEDLGAIDLDYFVYRAHAEKPTLQLLPNPKPLYFEPREIGLLPSADGGDFVVAVVRPRRAQLEYDIHIFSSKTYTWTTRLALLEPPSPRYKTEYLVHETDMVITVDGGTLGCVDLWRGIMLCNVLDSAPVLHYIRFPKPIGGNTDCYLESPARAVRDVTCSNGFIKLVEIEERKGLAATAARASNSHRNSKGTGSTVSYAADGLAAVSWKRKAFSKNWTKDCTAYVNESSILSVFRHKHPESSALENLIKIGPVWSTHEEDVFYLMAKADLKDKNAWAVTINMTENTVKDVTSFPAERYYFFKLAYHPFALSKYLNLTLDDCKAAAGSQIQERLDSKNDPNNIMVLVEGLDPFVNESQLQGILAMFGELCYLKLHVSEQYGLVQFASRSCAEEAIRTLNGAQIGRQGVRLSWRRRNLNKLPPKRRFSERRGANYRPYACCYGVHSYMNTEAQD